MASRASVWIEAARPKTLPAAVIPVLVGTAFAWAHGAAHFDKAAVCLVFALLVQIGRDEGLERITAEILHENRAMQQVCRKLGFTLRPTAEFVHAEILLT